LKNQPIIFESSVITMGMELMRQFFSVAFLVALVGCGGTKKDEVLEIPTDMPEICRGIDFVAQPDMRELCGVRPARYQSYKNIPLQRYLIAPKGASIVKKNEDLELRLPNTLPIPLPASVAAGLEFSQDKRLEFIKNTMTYKELFPAGQDRIKMFKLELPLDQGGVQALCFNLPEVKIDSRKRSHMGTTIESLDCADFDNIVSKYAQK
jgi:hypothetical protein